MRLRSYTIRQSGLMSVPMLARPVEAPAHWTQEAIDAARETGYFLHFAMTEEGLSLWDFEAFSHVPFSHRNPAQVLAHVRSLATPEWWVADEAVYADRRPSGRWYPKTWDAWLGDLDIPEDMTIEE